MHYSNVECFTQFPVYPHPNMPLQTTFHSETPRKLKMSSVPHNVQNFDIPTLKESFHSELGASIFDENTLLPSLYQGDIIEDCWFPDRVLPVVPSAELLDALTGPDGQPLYDSSTKQWDGRYLPPMLHKVGSQHRLSPGQEEKELGTFMSAVMDALIRHCDDGSSSATPGISDPSCSLPSKTNTSTSMQFPPAISPTTSIPDNSSTGASTPAVSIPDVSSPCPPPSELNAKSGTSMPRPLSLNVEPASPNASMPATFASDTLTPTSSPLSSVPSPQSDYGASAPCTSHRPKYKFPPRLWSSVTATRPLSGDSLLKPDCILVRQLADGITGPLGWEDVLMTAELTSRQQTLDLTVQIESWMLAMFNAQPNRAFAYSLSFHNGQY